MKKTGNFNAMLFCKGIKFFFNGFPIRTVANIPVELRTQLFRALLIVVVDIFFHPFVTEI